MDQLWDTLQGFHWGWKGQPLQPNLVCVCLGCLYNSFVKISIWWIWCCWFSVCWLNPHFLLVKFPFAVSLLAESRFVASSPPFLVGHPGSPWVTPTFLAHYPLRPLHGAFNTYPWISSRSGIILKNPSIFHCGLPHAFPKNFPPWLLIETTLHVHRFQGVSVRCANPHVLAIIQGP